MLIVTKIHIFSYWCFCNIPVISVNNNVSFYIINQITLPISRNERFIRFLSKCVDFVYNKPTNISLFTDSFSFSYMEQDIVLNFLQSIWMVKIYLYMCCDRIISTVSSNSIASSVSVFLLKGTVGCNNTILSGLLLLSKALSRKSSITTPVLAVIRHSSSSEELAIYLSAISDIESSSVLINISSAFFELIACSIVDYQLFSKVAVFFLDFLILFLRVL